MPPAIFIGSAISVAPVAGSLLAVGEMDRTISACLPVERWHPLRLRGSGRFIVLRRRRLLLRGRGRRRQCIHRSGLSVLERGSLIDFGKVDYLIHHDQHEDQSQHTSHRRYPENRPARVADGLTALRASRCIGGDRLQTARAVVARRMQFGDGLSHMYLIIHQSRSGLVALVLPTILFPDLASIEFAGNKIAGATGPSRYNRRVRHVAVFLLLISLAACGHSVANNDAVRQGIVDYLAGIQGLNVQAMEVKLESVQFNASKADAAVSIFLKGNTDPFMKKTYHLEQKSDKWVVIPSQEATGHGMAAPAPGAANPHGGAAPSGGKMPSPEDLPPASKKP